MLLINKSNLAHEMAVLVPRKARATVADTVDLKPSGLMFNNYHMLPREVLEGGALVLVFSIRSEVWLQRERRSP